MMRRLIAEEKKLNKEATVNGDQFHSQQLQALLQRQVQLQHHLQQQRASMASDEFEDDASDSGQGRPILKIPSFKPAVNKNGDTILGQGFPGPNAVSPGLLERASPAFSGTSSPTNSLVGKGMAVNFRDVIAKSISMKFQEGQPTIIAG